METEIMETDLKERNGCVSFWLWAVLIANVVLTIYYAVIMFDSQSREAALGIGLCSILGLLTVLGAILLMRWNKNGFYMMAFSSIMAIIVNIFILKMEPGTTMGSLVSIFIWWAILQIKEDGVSAWSQLQSGWDVKHCRHLYQLFAVIGVILFVLTLVAFGNAEKDYPDVHEDEITTFTDDELMSDEEVAKIFNDDLNPGEDTDSDILDESVSPQPKEEKQQKENPISIFSKESNASEDPVDNTVSKQKAAEQLLKHAIDNANTIFPQDTGMGIVVTRMYLSGDYVMYVAECDEDLINMDLLEQSKASMLSELRNMVGNKSDPEIAQMVQLCANAGKGIGYSYVGDTSGQKVTVRISNAELRKLL